MNCKDGMNGFAILDTFAASFLSLFVICYHLCTFMYTLCFIWDLEVFCFSF